MKFLCLVPLRSMMAACVLGTTLGLLPNASQADEVNEVSATQRVNVVDNAGAGQRWAEAYIQPSFATLTHAAGNLVKEIQGICANSGRRDAALLGEAFKNVVDAWSRVLFLRFGPLVEANRYERISFWPDVRNVGARQIPKIIGQYEAGQAPELSKQSVAVQGLPALEYVLYREGGLIQAVALGEPFSKVMKAQCDYAAAIAGNLVATANELESTWSEQGAYGKAFKQPGPAAAYRSLDEVLSEGIKAMATGLQFTSDIQIKPALTSGNSKLLPYWRSDQTLSALRAGIVGMREFMAAGQLSLGEQGWAQQQFLAELTRADALLQGPEDFEAVALILDNARALLVQDIAPAAGVALGFNALDGD
ncbi:imelysin family protein [Pusillimonas sp. NJUB218]|uniref:imelysin family protein n=1 Tax=Pusillimonas sp. NJUB218 TaxID=2023230 RepID=UPI0013155017|nr:imelysin family protein [Pusillimonas sp. NJUB218]